MLTEFIPQHKKETFSSTVKETAPSNIALIKYWGKYLSQIPANPSISYTLTNCHTNTELSFEKGQAFSVKVLLSGEEKQDFAFKIEKYFRSIERYLPWILEGSYLVKTENSFPHSSGIASSASGFAALAKCLLRLDQLFGEEESLDLKKASFLARLGSGSAARSLEEGMQVWGETPEVEGSSDLYAVSYPSEEIHPVFKDFNDYVLLIHEGEKSVSSTAGHNLMNDHPYAQRRFEEARENFTKIKSILKSGALEDFIELVEHEALTLHALMMMSSPAYLLMRPETLSVLQSIWRFRKETGHPLFFTLDAGANVHLLFPSGESKEAIEAFIEKELLPFSQKGGLVKDRMVFA